MERQASRQAILALVREMAAQFPEQQYEMARADFGLLGQIKHLCGNERPTARECWEAVGLHRSRLADEFYFSQEDQKNAARVAA